MFVTLGIIKKKHETFCYSHRGGTGTSTASGGSERAEAEVAVEQAWAELAAVEREQESARAERLRVERQLEQVRLRGAQLEQVSTRSSVQPLVRRLTSNGF